MNPFVDADLEKLLTYLGIISKNVCNLLTSREGGWQVVSCFLECDDDIFFGIKKAHPAGFEPTAYRLGVFVRRVHWRSSEVVKALWCKDGGRFTVRLSLHFSI